jgi:hypothetical protein
MFCCCNPKRHSYGLHQKNLGVWVNINCGRSWNNRNKGNLSLSWNDENSGNWGNAWDDRNDDRRFAQNWKGQEWKKRVSTNKQQFFHTI